MKSTNEYLKGIIFVLLGASFWGIGGTASDFLFEHSNIQLNWFVSMRLTISGMLLLGVQMLFTGIESIFKVWTDAKGRISLIIFSLLGMLLVQYSYSASIEAGNAAVATLLQYIAPVYILLWFIIRGHQKLQISDFVAITLTIVGTFLLLTNGSFKGLSVSKVAFIWGVISGLSLAFYTLYARQLLRFYSSVTIVGWAMLIAGTSMNIIHPVWKVEESNWSFFIVIILTFTIIFGTTLSFLLFIKSLEYIGAKEAILLGTFEPLVAVVSSVIWLKLSFGFWQVIGMSLIIILVVYLSLAKREEGEQKKSTYKTSS